jgi:hypothetical protein
MRKTLFIMATLFVVISLVFGGCESTPETEQPGVAKETYLTYNERNAIVNRDLILIQEYLSSLTHSYYGKTFLANFLDAPRKIELTIVINGDYVTFLRSDESNIRVEITKGMLEEAEYHVVGWELSVQSSWYEKDYIEKLFEDRDFGWFVNPKTDKITPWNPNSIKLEAELVKNENQS